MGDAGGDSRQVRWRVDRSTAGWFLRNALVSVGIVLLVVGLWDAARIFGLDAGGYAVLFFIEWCLFAVFPVVAVGLAVPGSAPYVGVSPLALTPARRRSVLTGGVVVGLAGPAWNWMNWTLFGVVAHALLPHVLVGVPLVLYGLWPRVAGRPPLLGRLVSAASSRVRAVGGRVAEGVPPGVGQGVAWLSGLLGVALAGYGVFGFVRLSGMSFGGDASGAAIGLAVLVLALSVYWGVGLLGLALAWGPLAGARTSGARAARSFMVLGGLLAVFGPVPPLLPLFPGRLIPTGTSLQFVGVELIVAGLVWYGYDRATDR